MKHRRILQLVFVLAALFGGLVRSVLAVPALDAKDVLARTPLRNGVCAVLDDRKAALSIALCRESGFKIYIQIPDRTALDEARRSAAGAGCLGTRIFIDGGGLDRIHLADNLADVVVAGPEDSSAGEIRRVLAPGGVGLIGKRKIDKTLPRGAEAWSHPYHGPDNNPQSADKVARAPYLTQFMAAPQWCSMPQVSVAAGGRIYKAFGHISHKKITNDSINNLLAVDAWNGEVLWSRPLRQGFMIHRNTMIATGDGLLLADDESCKVLDGNTGKMLREIRAPAGAIDGGVWKWMGLEDDTLYALVGGPETQPKSQLSGEAGYGHWPWGMWKGYDYADPRTNFGFGRTFMAVNPASGKVLWSRNVEDYVDGRAVCMAGGRIYAYAPGKAVFCLNARNGRELWRNTEAAVLQAIGPDKQTQHWSTGFSTTAYMKCSDHIIAFAGPQRPNLVALSPATGKLLWQRTGGNYHLVIRGDVIYAMIPWDKDTTSLKLETATGRELAKITARYNCTRATGSADSIFFRSSEGTVRLEVETDTPRHIAAMRPPCQDGVIISDGLLFWGPWMCGCNLSLYGHLALGPRGAQGAPPDVAPRLAKCPGVPSGARKLAVRTNDWATFRGDNARSSATPLPLAPIRGIAWTWQPSFIVPATTPCAAGGLVFVPDRAGAIRAFDAATGRLAWEHRTGGMVAVAPAISDGRLFAGSADGCVYALDAVTGAELWRFLAAPHERWIPVFGQLASTWPVNGGVVAEGGVVYAAAGIAHHDGISVWALDAVTGEPRWANHDSGRLSEKTESGISLQGELAITGGRLRFPGGNACPDAVYELATGKCLTQPNQELTAPAATTYAAYYPEQAWAGYDFTFDDGSHLVADWGTGMGPKPIFRGTPRPPDPNQPWITPYDKKWVAPRGLLCRGLIRGPDAVVVVGTLDGSPVVIALDIANGMILWQVPLKAEPVTWGLAVDADNRIFVALKDGSVVCLAQQ